jgi:hypothetical protein
LKKTGIIALLCIFLFNTAGYYVVFLTQQMQIRSEIRSQINAGYYDKNFTSVITLNKSELRNVEFFDDGNEMEYKGSRYDIARKTESNENVTFYCINDSEETSLLAKLDNHISTHVAAKPIKDNSSKKLTDNVVKIYFMTDNSFHLYQADAASEFIPAGSDCLPAEKQKSTPPPPEFC